MAKIKIVSITGENFMSYKDRNITLGNRTILKGRNKCGKTTSKHLVNWVLLNKNADGKTPDGIRPHDASGKDTDHVEIVGTLILDVDGREVKIQKVQKQIWRTDRKTKEQKFDGNINVIYMNDNEIKEKDFKAWFDRVIGEETFMICSNAGIFTSKNAKDRRDILFKMIPSYSNEDIVRLNPRFLNVSDSLHLGTPEEVNVEDAISAVKRRISGRGRGDKGLKGEQEAIPVRIDEVSKGICDVSEYELSVESLRQKLCELDTQESELNEQIKAFDEKINDLMDLKFEQSEIVKGANAGLVSKKSSLNDEIFELEMKKREAANSLKAAEMDLRHANMGIERHSADKKRAQEEYTKWIHTEFDDSELQKILSETFDEDSLVCSECGQVYPEEMKLDRKSRWEKNHALLIAKAEKSKSDFEDKKNRKIKEITESGNTANAELKTAQAAKKDAEDKISRIRKEISDLELKISEKQKEIDALPDSVDMSENEGYLAITKKISEMEEMIQKSNSGSERRAEITKARNSIISEIASYQEKIKASHEAQERVNELKKELSEVSQKIADAQQELDNLEDFNRTKIEMITDKINENFKFIKFRMFRKLVNGDYEPCCEMLVNGTSYDGNLNTGDKLLAELDLLSTFQRINNVSVPVFLDSAGEVDPDRVPETDFQLIMLQRTNDKELTVEVTE